jgi:hypothetical protein
MPGFNIRIAPGRISPGQRNNSHKHQQNAAEGFGLDKFLYWVNNFPE